MSPLEIFFQEQSYSSLHSGWSLAWDHVRGDIDNPCCAIADFCGVIADPYGVVAIPGAIGRRRSLRDSLNIIKHHEIHVKHCDTSWTTSKTSWNTLKTLWTIMKHSSFDATISALDAETSALDVETSAFGAAMSAIARRSFDATISALNAETSVLGALTSAIARSYRQYRCRVSGDIRNCGVGITPQMCNRVTNHGDMSTFSKPDSCYVQHRWKP